MKKIILTLALVLGLNTIAFGFATQVQFWAGGDRLNFTANVEGVNVFQNGVKVGMIDESNYSTKLKRSKETQVFTFKKQGYQDVTIPLTTKRSGLFWGNLIYTWAGSFASSTDSWITGADRQYSPSNYYIEMTRI
tara:strand:+ start:388 stop:792 length:405 start_codon:yes stop_codon:yes gene_type:complete